ncbi:spore coat protein [Metabacillus iocasae]|uniref:Spore coat protein D n=1 Tax=Priestia iocasae TaxID=2291674 RepID=A0ABS2QUV6_9BACI|nr:spore coat protein [Metabacillus iocasae]MBM7703273.1 spore coat protein D [Metabacillus iocasae]
MYCRPTKCCPPIVHPTKCNTQFSAQDVVVPHIHPSHTTFVNQTNFKHVHYFPQTQSTVNEETSQQFIGGPGQVAGAQQMPGMMPGMMPGGMPGQVAGAQQMPGMMPGMMPGGMPGQVAGAQQMPGMMPGANAPFPGQVAGAQQMPGGYPGKGYCR